ncbi:MAG TPA: energy-coupling factor transporter transmembrane component T [Streptosporangiaceae bacterium]|nr:energy-coupling factor transporter transmembrane component T [Streptosporangiaceae bacterium]
MMHTLLVRTVISYLLIFAVPMLLPVAFFKLVGLGGLRELVTYEARDTPLHNLDPRLKILYPVAMGVLSILLSWKLMLAVFGLTIIPWFWLRPSKAKIRVLMVMVIGPALAGFWGQGMYYLPPPPIHYVYQFPWTLSWLGSPGITTYGMIFGLQQSARVLVTVSTSMLILISTDVGDFTWAFERFQAPPQVGFAITAALRFLPEMISRTTLVLRAIELRGYDLSRPKWHQFNRWPDYVRRIARAVGLITVPLLVGSLRGTATMAMVADARGFGVSRKRGSLRVHKVTAFDIGAYIVLAILVIGAFVLNHLHIGARYYG